MRKSQKADPNDLVKCHRQKSHGVHKWNAEVIEDNDSSAVAAVLDQLHEALGDVLDGEEAVVLLQLVSVAVSSFLVLQDCSVRKRGADTLDLDPRFFEGSAATQGASHTDNCML